MQLISLDNQIGIKMKYDPGMIQKIKKIPGRIWNPDKKIWILPKNVTTINQLLKLSNNKS